MTESFSHPWMVFVEVVFCQMVDHRPVSSQCAKKRKNGRIFGENPSFCFACIVIILCLYECGSNIVCSVSWFLTMVMATNCPKSSNEDGQNSACKSDDSFFEMQSPITDSLFSSKLRLRFSAVLWITVCTSLGTREQRSIFLPSSHAKIGDYEIIDA